MDDVQPPQRASVGPGAAALSIALFWTLYYLSVSARSVIMQYSGYARMFDNRAVATAAGIGLTWLLYLFLRRLDERSLGVRIAAAFLASVPVATGYAAANYAAFRAFHADEVDTPGLTATTAMPKREKSVSSQIADNSIHWYFLVLSWAALYLALSYAAQVRASEREAARLKAAAQSAELKALRYQVNPHFLFNTLNSISSLVISGRAAQAEAMILNLSRFFRTSLADDPTEDARLAEEIALQRLYLDIEAVRFSDRLRVQIEVEPGLEDACVPGMILQPLVENAIKHGVSPSKRPVTVRLTAARAEDSRIRLVVEDDGESGSSASGTGVGLRNVADRVRVRFGDAAEVRAERPAEGGFRASVSMPLVRDGC